MDELERRLRDSLRNRADDVEPTPDLWLEVRDRRERKRRLRWVAAAGAVAAAAVIAVVAVPAALDALRTGGDLVVAPGPVETELPTPQPTPSGPPPSEQSTARPSELETGPAGTLSVGLATDGRSIFPFGNGGAVGATIYTFPSEGHSSVVSIAVRPGSTADDLTAVLLTQAEGTYDLRWLTWDGADASVQLFPDPYNIRNHAVGGSVPSPVWSPDGRHVAWVEDGDDGAAGLRVIGWGEEGPGTGRSADDNTSFADLGIPGDADVRLQDWAWTSGSGEQRVGTVLATALGGGGYAFEVVRQADGAIVLDAIGPIEADGALLDVALDDRGVEYRLTGRGAGEGVIDLALSRTSADGRTEELPLPEDLDTFPGSDPTGLWMNAAGDGAVVGDGARVWAVTQVSGAGWVATPVQEGLGYAALAP